MKPEVKESPRCPKCGRFMNADYAYKQFGDYQLMMPTSTYICYPCRYQQPTKGGE